MKAYYQTNNGLIFTPSGRTILDLNEADFKSAKQRAKIAKDLTIALNQAREENKIIQRELRRSRTNDH